MSDVEVKVTKSIFIQLERMFVDAFPENSEDFDSGDFFLLEEDGRKLYEELCKIFNPPVSCPSYAPVVAKPVNKSTKARSKKSIKKEYL